MNIKILIVEDDRNIADMLQFYICDQRRHKECYVARTLAQALEAVKNTRYDLILLDILLEDKDCMPVIRLVRDLYKDKPPLLVIMSAMTGADRFAEMNAIRTLVKKPFAFESIDEIVGLGDF